MDLSHQRFFKIGNIEVKASVNSGCIVDKAEYSVNNAMDNKNEFKFIFK